MRHPPKSRDSQAQSSRKPFPFSITFLAVSIIRFLAIAIPRFLASPINRLPTNLILVVITCHELRWLNHNIYAHRPFFDSIPSAYIDTGINWVTGFVYVSFFVAIRRGPFPFFRNPRNYFGADTFRLLSSKYLTIILAMVIPTIFFLIQLFPAIHLDYEIDGDKPIVKVNCILRHFVGPSIYLCIAPNNYLCIDPNTLESTFINVSDRQDFYSIRVRLSDVSRSDPWFRNHQRVTLNDLFAHIDIRATLTDSQPEETRTYTFNINYEDGDLEKQCADSDHKNYFRDGECRRFFRTLFDDMSATSTGMKRDATGSFEFSDHAYEYKYRYGEPKRATILINALPQYAFRRKSLIFKDAANAFHSYQSLDNYDERQKVAREFSEEIGALPTILRNELFSDLSHNMDDVATALSTKDPAQENLALSFVKDILVPGSIHLSAEQKKEIISHISKSGYDSLGRLTNVENIDSDTVALMIEIQLSLQRNIQTLAIVRRTLVAMWTIGNITPKVVDAIFTPLARDGVNRQEAESVAGIINVLCTPDPHRIRGQRIHEPELKKEIESVISKHWSMLPTNWIEPYLNK